MKLEEKLEVLELSPKERYIPFSEKNVPIRIDEVFKIVMSQYRSRKYLKEFLEAILDKKINSIIVAEAEKLLGKDFAKDKDMKVDLLVQFDNDEILDVEIQNKNEKNIFERSLAYGTKILYNDYKKGDGYIKGNKTIIWIMDFNLSEESNNYHEIYSYKNLDSSDVKHLIEHHFIQLPRFIEKVRKIQTEEEKWLAYFSGQLNSEEIEVLFKMSRSIKEINEIVEAVMTDPQIAYVLQAREGRELERFFDKKSGYLEGIEEGKKEGIEQGIEQGIEKGEYKKQIEIAKKMLAKGKNIDEIIEFTELPREKIENLNA